MRNLLLLLLPTLMILPSMASAELIDSSDLTYLGAFKLPDLPSGYTWLLHDGAGYNSGGMTYYPPHNSLLVMGGPGNIVTGRRFVAEVSIPGLIEDSYNNINTCTMLHDFVDIVGVDNTGTYAGLGDIHYYTRQGSQGTDKIYVSIYGSYSSNAIYQIANGHFAWTEADLDNLERKGWWRFFDVGSSLLGKYLFHAPKSWADDNVDGKSLIAGYYRGGGGYTEGPTLFAFAPWEHCGGEPMDCDSYPPPDAENGEVPGCHPVYNPTCAHDPWYPDELKNWMNYTTLLRYGTGSTDSLDGAAKQDRWNSGAWITVGDKSALVILGWKAARATADYRFSYGTHPVYAGYQGSSYYSLPGRPVLLFYDPDDLAAVADGTLQSYEPQPYAIMEMSPFFYAGTDTGGTVVNGLAYDETDNIIYVGETSSTYKAIHAFSLSDISTSLDTTPPSAPVLSASATNEQVSLTWTESIDGSGSDIVYQLFKNEIPFLFTTDLYFTDTVMEYMHSPVEYYVIARDSNGNEARSNTIFVDDTNGGNAPLTMFIPSLAGTPHHETSYGFIMIAGQDYSMTPIAIGGTPPYTWSLEPFTGGLPDDIQINSNTGEITCSNHGNQWYRGIITLQDSEGNIHRRVVSWRSTTSSTDLDGDGYTVADGDADDNSINVHPGNPTQPAPTELTVDGTGDGSVTLSWNAAPQRTDVHRTQYYRSYEGEITYEIHLGTQPGVYTDSIYVGRTTSHILSNLPSDTYYISVTAYDFRGLESDYSDGVSADITGTGTTDYCGKVFGGSWEDGGSYAIQATDGGYLIVGTTSSWSASRTDRIHANDTVQDIYVVKTDSGGNEEWHRIVGDGGDDINSKQLGVSEYHRGTSAIETPDGGFLIAGYIAGGDGLIYKLGSNGALEWKKSYPSTNLGRGGIIQSDDGNYVVPGYINSDITLTKIDDDGNVLWSRTYSKPRIEYVRDIEKTSDGGYIIGGYDYQYEDEDFLLLKVDSNGNEEWFNTYGVSGVGNRDRAWGAIQAYDRGYIIAGRTNSFDLQGETDYFIVKTDPLGNEEWSKVSGDPKSHLLADIIKDDGNYVIAGYYHPSPEPYTGLIMSIDQSGNELWSRSVNQSEEIWSIKRTASGGYLLAGTSLSFTTSYDIYFTTTDSQGACDIQTTCSVSSDTYYYDKDMDGYGSYSEGSYLDTNMDATGMCVALDGYSLGDTDCDDVHESINPGAQELCYDGIDNDCDKLTDTEQASCITHEADLDEDGCVEMGELNDYIQRWFTDSQDVSMPEVMGAVTLWRSGEGCS